MSDLRTQALIDDLRGLPAETAWVEFKESNSDALLIGKLISALSNAARVADQSLAYVLWGVRNGDHVAVGTHFEPSRQLQQSQPLELWLAQRLQPAIAFNFKTILYFNKFSLRNIYCSVYNNVRRLDDYRFYGNIIKSPHWRHRLCTGNHLGRRTGHRRMG